VIDPVTARAARVATLVAVPVAVFVTLLLFWLVGGLPGDSANPRERRATPTSTAPVSVPAAALAPEAATVCRALLAKLPEAVSGLRQRPVAGGAEQNAAYGEPPLLLRCGVSPVTPPADSTEYVYALSRVCWMPDRTGRVWTTLDRKVPVSVTVPEPLSEPGQWVAAFSRYVAATPEGGRPPWGCTG
jgi:hypothetical protein